MRLRTLSNLRWLAIAGQSAALFLVYFALGYPPAHSLLRHRHRGQRRAEYGAGAALSRQPPPDQPRSHLLSGLRRAAAGGAAVSDRRHRQSLCPDVRGAGGDRRGHAQSGQYADPGGHRLRLGVADRHRASAAALAGRRGAAAAAALSGRHLGGAGDRHRLHLGLCLAHRLGIDAHVGGPGRHPAGAGARASPGVAGRAGDGGGA